MKIAVVGGTGDFGLALAQRLAEAGDDVVIGSRDAERAQEKAAEVGAAAGAANEDAVRGVDLVVLAMKADAALPTAASLADAIGETPVLSVASELRFTKQGVLPDRGRAVDRRADAGARCAPGRRRACTRSPPRRSRTGRRTATRSSAATTSARRSSRSSSPAKVVAGRALDAGPLASARALEGMTAVIVNLNKRYKGHAGVRVVGLP